MNLHPIQLFDTQASTFTYSLAAPRNLGLPHGA